MLMIWNYGIEHHFKIWWSNFGWWSIWCLDNQSTFFDDQTFWFQKSVQKFDFDLFDLISSVHYVIINFNWFQWNLKYSTNVTEIYSDNALLSKIQLVMVILTAPATQVSVERAFPALALLMDDITVSCREQQSLTF